MDLSFLRARRWQLLTVLMLAQAGFYYGRAKSVEHVPIVRPLSEFPQQVGLWRNVQEGVVEQEVRDVLKADDLLSRSYSKGDGAPPATLFIAYFKSQRTGVAPHSPKNCLPGSGWEFSKSGTMKVSVPGGGNVEVNRYLVSRGEHQSLVAYWYHSRNRVVASEYSAKVYTVMDSIRYNRSDTAIVRVVIPVIDHKEEAAEDQARQLIEAVYPNLSQYFPG